MSQAAATGSPNHVAATISQSSGPVTVERHGSIIELGLGDAVYASDTIKTGKHSVELSFIDGAKASLGPGSVMSLQEFSYNPHNEAESSFVLNLAAGALRAVSGQVVEQNPDAFKIITPKATAGIRGTDLAIELGSDGSESFVLISIDLGHTLVVTAHSGGQVSLSFSNEGAIIPAGENAPIPKQFSQEEVEDIIQAVVTALRALDSSTESSHNTTLLLEAITAEGIVQATLGVLSTNEGTQSLSQTLSAENVDSLIGMTETALAPSTPQTTETSLAPPQTNDPAPLPSVATSGNENFAADGMTLDDGKSHILVSQNLTITEDMVTSEVLISGDTFDISNGTSVVAGSDNITARAMSQGSITGDAYSLQSENDTLIAGSDTITLDSVSGFASIFGDIVLAEVGQVSFGHDSISIKGNALSVDIFGDTATSHVTSQVWGNDHIIIMGTMDGGNIHADGYNSDQGGNDTIFVSTTINNAKIYGNGGDDYITVQSLLGAGCVGGGGGNDTITIHTALGHSESSRATIDMEAGQNILNVENLDSNSAILSQGTATITATVVSTATDIMNSPTQTVMPQISCTNSEYTIYLDVPDSGNYHINLEDFDTNTDALYIDNTAYTGTATVNTQETFTLAGATLTIYFS